MSAARVAPPQDPYFQFHVTRDWTGKPLNFVVWAKPTARKIRESQCQDPAHPWFEIDEDTLPPGFDPPPVGHAYVCCACLGEVIE
jgi:hypothetical protein